MSNKIKGNDLKKLMEKVIAEVVLPIDALGTAKQIKASGGSEAEAIKAIQALRGKNDTYPSKEDAQDIVDIIFGSSSPPVPKLKQSPPASTTDNYGKTVTVNNHKVKVPKKADMAKLQPGTTFAFPIAKVPDELKKAILRTFQSYLSAGNELDDLASISEGLLVEDTTQLDWEDFAAILSDKKSPLFKPAVQAIKQIANTDAGQPYAQALTSMLTQNVDPQTSTSAAPAGIPTMDVSDMFGADRKSVPGYVVAAFDSMGLGQVSSVKERIKLINDYSVKLMQSAPKVDKMSLGEVMGSLAVLNGLGRIVQRMDDKAAGWAFESFLAQLVNGTTEGTAMGAADFAFGLSPNNTLPEGTYGSAKLLSSNEFSQATSTSSLLMPGMLKPAAKAMPAALKSLQFSGAGGSIVTPKDTNVRWGNDRVVYIIGIKKDASSAGIADPTKVQSVDIYMVTIKRTKGKGQLKNGDLQATGGTVKSIDSSIHVKVDQQGFVGTIHLAKDLSEIDKFGQSALTKIDTEIPKLLQQIETFSSSTKEYLIGGEASDVNKAVNGYASMYDLINKVFGSMGAASKQSGVYAGVQATSSGVTAKTATALAEQKITADFLKKIISESFKK